MDSTRRGFFALLAGFLVLPFAKPTKMQWEEWMQMIWADATRSPKLIVQVPRMHGKSVAAKIFAEDLEKAFLGTEGEE